MSPVEKETTRAIIGRNKEPQPQQIGKIKKTNRQEEGKAPDLAGMGGASLAECRLEETVPCCEGKREKDGETCNL